MAPKTMSAEHKQALAAGRNEGRAVKAYLDALDQNRPRRGRKRTADTVKRRLAAIEKDLPEATSLKRLQLVQERRDLEAELESMGAAVDLSKVEAEFVKVAGAYGRRKGIAYATWRELGVSPEVLKKAGITRGS
ncbi:MAG TPA: hypothetical protein VFC99_02380 [Acidimicrobiia bacterium]|nr:hypothetical protein [Acidimicrobiia bacterium]